MIFFFPGCILYPESSGVYQGRVLADLLNLHGFSHPDVLNGIIDVNSLLMSSDPKFGMVPLNDICIIFLNIYIYIIHHVPPRLFDFSQALTQVTSWKLCEQERQWQLR